MAATIAVVAALALGASPAHATTYPYSGTILSCNWSVSVDDQANTFDGSITCPVGDTTDISLTATATCTPSTIDSGGQVEFTSIAFSFGGQDYSDTLDQTFDVPACPSTVADAATGLQATVQQFISDAEERATTYLLEQLAAVTAGLDLQQDVDALESNMSAYCPVPSLAETEPSPWCAGDGSDLTWMCKQSGGCPLVGGHGFGDYGHVDDPSGGNSVTDQQTLCPELPQSQDNAIYVCVPSIVQGDWSAGDKSIVVLPGGALLAAPVGGNLGSLHSGPTISSNTAIVSLGGIVGGVTATFKAPKIELAGNAVEMLDDLTLDGGTIWLGKVDIDDTVGALYDPIGVLMAPYAEQFGLEVPQSGTLAAPVDVAASTLTVKAKTDLTIASGSRLDTSGRGGAGGLPGTSSSPSGETDMFGGSHGGLGAFPGAAPGDAGLWDLYRTMGGRVATFDDPFAPSQVGDGGAADNDVRQGAPGGGVMRIEAAAATVQLDGSIDVSGGGIGLDSNPIWGGAGAGGSISMTAGTLAGAGQLSADGGSYTTAANPGDNVGGPGGGGRIALVYGDASGWTGKAHAYGGSDQQYPGPLSSDAFNGTGGAGTVFTRQVVFDSSGGVAQGAGTYPDGTLTIDGGMPAGYFPQPDGTPLLDSWSDPARQLVLAGDARVYGSTLNYADIEVLSGAVLTTMGDQPDQSLSLTTQTLHVDPTGRIDVSGRGEAGGSGSDTAGAGAGGAADGQSPSTDGYGGSYGGAGGGQVGGEPADAHAGSTYGDPQDPALPGGGGAGQPTLPAAGLPGGGVLTITTGVLSLDGTLASDGQSGDAPTPADLELFSVSGGAGAGGSVLVHAQRVAGSGTISAAGGDSCLTSSMLLTDESNCPYNTGQSGGGGGGRVALIATYDCGWQGHLVAPGGEDPTAADDPLSKGEAGSTYFPTPAACPSDGGGGGGTGGGTTSTSTTTTTTTGTTAGTGDTTGAGTTGSTTSGTPRIGGTRFDGKALTVTVTCSGPATSRCVVTLTLSVIETLRGSKLVGVTARADAKLKRRTVVIGRVTATVGGGRTQTVRIKLNRTGKALLARHRRLAVDLRAGQAKRRLTLTRRR